ncbi:DUF3034 family protein [Phenylobacterium montanum]|uniref:DUF3034 family protein n=1 Tax=Phenylobacterium montanum TaxID=2823693 RepID=A0A975G248_9CAUL|nr:DUF3034 family protein [Caulobacter sp. S6]QUD89199.1 DUF3034 family protein [Caulobacter sp. S6]
MRTPVLLLSLFAVTLGLPAGAAEAAEEIAYQGKLLLTGGVSSIEGAGGGGLATWAVTTGYATRDGYGANLHATYIALPNFTLTSYGAAMGIRDRLELSYARQSFDTGETGAKLGLGKGFTFDQDVVGAKLHVLGDAVYDQDRWWPQVSVGVQYKHNGQAAVLHAVGARQADGVDYYVAATKLLLDRSLVLNEALRETRANQTGLLGFGGDRSGGYALESESSVGVMLSRRLVVGGEYRTKPDNLRFARENDWWDLFAAYALNKHVSATLAYVNLGDIATFRRQDGVYVSLQTGF